MSTGAFPGDPLGAAGGPAPGMLRRGARVQAAVIHALFFREIQTRFGRSGMGFVWLFLEPLLLSLAIAAMKIVMFGGTERLGIPTVLFAIVGYAPFFAFRAIVSRSAGAVSGNMPLMFHRQVSMVDVMAARSALEAMAVLGVLVVILGGAAWLLEFAPNDIPLALLGLFLLYFYAHGLAMLVAAATAGIEGVERLVHPLTYMMLPVSGALIALDTMPQQLREWILWNPQAHFHELIRDGFFGDKLRTYYEWDYMIGAVLILNLLGLAALRAVRPHLEA